MTFSWHNLAKLTKRKKRLGRGIGSHGAKSGRGMKGQRARAGFSQRAGFEGGQTPLYQRLPKGRGAKRTYSSQVVKPEAVKIEELEVFKDGEIVGLGKFIATGLVARKCRQVKLVGNLSVNRKLTVRVHSISRQARESIEKAGGKVEIINR